MQLDCRPTMVILLMIQSLFFIQIIILISVIGGNFGLSFSMSLLHTYVSFLCLQETLIFLSSLAIEWFLSFLRLPMFSKNESTCVTFLTLTFCSFLRPWEVWSAFIGLWTLPCCRPQASCHWGPFLSSTVCLMFLQFSIPLTKPLWKLSILSLCGSPDSLTTCCQTLVPCPPPPLASRYDLYSSFLCLLGTDFST